MGTSGVNTTDKPQESEKEPSTWNTIIGPFGLWFVIGSLASTIALFNLESASYDAAKDLVNSVLSRTLAVILILATAIMQIASALAKSSFISRALTELHSSCQNIFGAYVGVAFPLSIHSCMYRSSPIPLLEWMVYVAILATIFGFLWTHTARIEKFVSNIKRPQNCSFVPFIALLAVGTFLFFYQKTTLLEKLRTDCRLCEQVPQTKAAEIQQIKSTAKE